MTCLPTRFAAGASVVAAALALCASCTQDFDQLFTTAAAAGAGGAGGGSGAGGSGAAAGCSSPADCPGVDSTCSQRACDSQGQCGVKLAPAATYCDQDGGQVCDGAGHCVECSTAAQCQPGELCQQNQCVPEACSNGSQDGTETDVDCGGADCAPCANGQQCQQAGDCLSQFCDQGGGGGGGGTAGGVCAPCGSDGDCAPVQDSWCDPADNGGSCVPQKVDGELCSGGNECQSGYCPAGDGVCCDSPCDATCQACLQGKTGSPNGSCDLVLSATDPDGECGAQPQSTCGSDGSGCSGSSTSCILWPGGTVCAAQSCNGSTLSSERQCDGNGGCQAAATSSCAPYTCNGGGTACRTSCSSDSHCVNGYVCLGSSCVQLQADGQPCSSGAECQSGNCPPQDGVCCNTPCAGSCQACLQSKTGSADGTCLLVLSATDPDGECGAQPQSSCGSDGSGCSGSSNACILWPGGTICVPQSCSGSTLFSERQCNGSGTCQPGFISSCAPYVCNGGGTACRTSCSSDSHCVNGYVCLGSSCVQQLKADGQPCSSGAECQSGNCPPQDGVCCNTPCNTQCEACLGGKTGGSDGICTAVSGGFDPDGECPNAPGPCGPDGNGCNGDQADPHCAGPPCNCDQQYTAPEVLEYCGQSGQQCLLRTTTQNASCDQICAAGGGECLSAYNDAPNFTCNIDFNQPLSCSFTGYLSMICICSRGCGGDASCEPPFVCSGGDCQ